MDARAFVLSGLLLASNPAAAAGLHPETGEFPLETLRLVAATEALFDRLESETANPARETPQIELRLARPDASPASLPAVGRRAVREDLGAIEHLTAYGLTWYPLETLSGTVDFVGSWDGGRNLVCGYVTWDMSDPEAPVLAAMTTSYLDTSVLVGLPDDLAHGELLRANCAHGSIEPNLELIRPDPRHFP